MQVSSRNRSEGVSQTTGIETKNDVQKNDLSASLFKNEFSPTGAIERNLVDRNNILRTGLNNTFTAAEANRFNYNSIQGVRGNPNVTAEFINGVENMAQRLGTRPEYLMAVMSFETGGTFNPGIRNGIGATGLIQFLPSTARGLGTTTDQLAQMSSTEQLRYVEKYFDQPHLRGKLGTLEGLYTAVLSGSARSNSNDVLFNRGTRAYEQNPLDWNQDGRITAGEAITPVAARMYGGIRAVQQRLVDAGVVRRRRTQKLRGRHQRRRRSYVGGNPDHGRSLPRSSRPARTGRKLDRDFDGSRKSAGTAADENKYRIATSQASGRNLC